MQTLNEMAREYLNAADLLSQQIESCRHKLHKAVADGDVQAQYSLRSFMTDLYVQRGHVNEIAYRLKTYYDRP